MPNPNPNPNPHPNPNPNRNPNPNPNPNLTLTLTPALTPAPPMPLLPRQRLSRIADGVQDVWRTVLYMSYATVQKHRAFEKMM